MSCFFVYLNLKSTILHFQAFLKFFKTARFPVIEAWDARVRISGPVLSYWNFRELLESFVESAYDVAKSVRDYAKDTTF